MQEKFINPDDKELTNRITDYLDKEAGFKTILIKTIKDKNRLGIWFYVEKYKKDKKMTRRVRCHFCNKPIHISKFAGIFSVNGDSALICNNFVCLVEYVEFRKKEKGK